MQDDEKLDLGEGVELVETDLVDVKAVEERSKVVTMEDVGWDKYIMSLFHKSELDGKHPKLKGIRRVLRKKIGPILKNTMTVKQFPSESNSGSATVECTIEVLNKYYLEPGELPYILIGSDAAHASSENIVGDDFVIYPVAIASTRALVRAMRQVLNLSVAAADEIANKPPREEQPAIVEEEDLISDGQIEKLDMFCERSNISVKEFVKAETGSNKVKRLLHSEGISLLRKLNDYQRKVVSVPEEILGYNPDWKVAK